MNGNRALAAVSLCVLLGACGPGNTLPRQGGSVDFRLKAVESSLQKAQEELKAIERKQTQNDARVAEMQKRLGELMALLQSHGMKPPAGAPQGSALGVGFARPGAVNAPEAMPSGSLPADQKRPGEPAPPPSQGQEGGTTGAAVSPQPADAATPPAQPASAAAMAAPPAPKGAPVVPPEGKGRRGYGRIGPAGPAPSTPEAAIAADRAETPATPPASPQGGEPEKPAATPPAAEAKAVTPPAVEARAASPVPGNAEAATPGEKAEYNKALQLAINGRVPEAKAAFDQFLAAHPRSPLAPNALYWVGEGAFASGDYRTAIDDFDKVAKGWPGHHKAADSLYKMAAAQEKSGDIAGARATLERYLKDYPNAELAGVVRQKLQSLPK